MNHASKSLWTSAFAAATFSSDILWSLFFPGFADGLAYNLCSIMSLLTTIRSEVQTSGVLIAYVIACSSKTSGACALSRRNLQKKYGNVSLSYCWQEKKSSSLLTFAWKPWNLTSNFYLSYAHDVMDLGGSLAYQLATTFSSDMINDLARVIWSPQNDSL
jgi:hypothetical protein